LKGDRVFKKTADLYPNLNKTIVSAIDHLESYDPDSPEYAKTVEQIIKLTEIDPGKKPKKTSLTQDAILAASVSILGILLVINKEATGAVTSKAFSMIRKA
jgi:hypothetical protein